jgi:hypothetical protein
MSRHKNSRLANWGKTFLLLLTGFFILFPEIITISSPALAQPPVHFSKWTEIVPMPTPRDSLLVLKQHDGRIVTIGGEAVSGVTNAVERYDPKTRAWDKTLPPYPMEVSYLCGVTLPDGRLFVSGGFNSSGFVRESYLLDPQKGSWIPTMPDPVARAGSMAAVLPGGDVLVTGGETQDGITDVTEIFRPSKNRWISLDSAPEGRLGGVAGRMPDGRVLVVGGLLKVGGITASGRYFNPKTKKWEGIVPPGPTPRLYGAGSVLPDGTFLFLDGFNRTGVLGSADRFDPKTGKWATLPFVDPVARKETGVAVLDDGSVIVVGGEDPRGNSIGNATLLK